MVEDCCVVMELNRIGSGCTEVGESYGIYKCNCGQNWHYYSNRLGDSWEKLEQPEQPLASSYAKVCMTDDIYKRNWSEPKEPTIELTRGEASQALAELRLRAIDQTYLKPLCHKLDDWLRSLE